MSRFAGRATIVALALLAGCSWSSGRSSGLASLEQLPHPTTTTTAGPSTTTTTTPAQRECSEQDLETKSYAPGGPDSYDSVAELRSRGYISVGVDENTLGFSERDPSTGEFSGFEVEISRQIAKQLFGDAYRVDSVRLIPVVTKEKIDFVRDGTLDMSIDANSMSCARWERVAFSAEYYTAEQQFLVRRDSPIRTRADLQGKDVCVTVGSSSLGILRAKVTEVTPVEQDDRTGCLLDLQEGTVDAYFGHDSFLYGMKLQDPTTDIRENVLPDVDTTSHYGIAIAQDRLDLVRFVNGVLEQMHADGTWDRLYEELRTALPGLPPATQPTPAYRDAP